MNEQKDPDETLQTPFPTDEEPAYTGLAEENTKASPLEQALRAVRRMLKRDDN